MEWLKSVSTRYPILTFIFISISFTWAVWFSVPFIAGDNWALGRIVVGAGFGPAIAAIVLNHLSGTGTQIGTKNWWLCFVVFFAILLGLYFSILVTGDAISAESFSNAKPVGFSVTSILASIISASVGSFIIACLLCSRSIALNSLNKWRISYKWWLVALFLPALWMTLGLLVAQQQDATITPISHSLEQSTWLLFIARSILLTFLVVAIGEESGWRAWMLPKLQERFSPLLSTVFVGIVWGVWHLPLFLIGQYDDPPEMIFAKTGACIMLGVIFTWLYNRSGGSLLMAVALHTTMNNTPKILPFSEQMGIFLLLAVISMIVVDRMWRTNKSDELAQHVNRALN
ncbi:CPBP family intramembrane metalloprotease [Shewanella sp. WXL01]|uniref:CPBP family intramembrane glutamic endopeptidase n=1 Tax=Shewanella sp. WXL01 TaxID=2709721 RepID=UPI0014385958|nr:type II CAAX endopeptidase family protein [Shewanella sp. WXL01]NKF50809.1 CPBP family intramembrane metalloprotease [Shewanella sp. WXL01]